jgi:hypothetical protein
MPGLPLRLSRLLLHLLPLLRLPRLYLLLLLS